KTIRAPIAFNDREIFLTASIGLALSDPQTQLSEEIIKDAELAMYHSKRIGGDRIDVYKPAMRARKTDRLTLESELRRAIERQEITILYQPIVRLEDRSIAGFEALARWDHPKLGRMSPSEFISIAEEIGLIVDLGLFVMDQTARQLSVWQRAMRSREPIFASVNVSSRQLLRHDLIHDIRTVLSRSSIARGTLKLELTESLVMENPEHAAQMLTRSSSWAANTSKDLPSTSRWTPTPRCGSSPKKGSRQRARPTIVPLRQHLLTIKGHDTRARIVATRIAPELCKTMPLDGRGR